MQAEPERAVPILERFLAGDHSLRLKERALFVLGQSDTPRAREILIELARRGTPPELRLKAIESLGIAGDADDVAALGAIWKDATPAVQAEDARGLDDRRRRGSRCSTSPAAPNDPAMRRKAIEMLGVMGATDALGELYASEKDPRGARQAARGVRPGRRRRRGGAGRARRERPRAAAQGDRDARRLRRRKGRASWSSSTAASRTALRRKIAESLMVNGDAQALIELFRQRAIPS
jgi:hypothetical protein